MYDYFSIKADQIADYKFETDNDIDEVLTYLNECYLLGMKILNYNYGREADEIFAKHGSMIWLSKDFKDKKYNKWKKITAQAESERKEDIKTFFKLISKHISDWWV